jgi:MFS family permease
MTQPQGMAAFVIVWAGQVASLIGTAMSQFALTVWAWKATGSAMTLSVIGFCGFAPMIVLMPFAGILVDRWDRKVTMAVSDAASGLATLAVLLLFATGRLQVWHLYVTSTFSASFQAFQWPAYSAAISTMIPRMHYARASGMLSIAQSASGIAGPAIAGALVASVGLPVVLVVDIVSCIVAVSVLTLVKIPRPARSTEGGEVHGKWWRQAVFGFQYIFARPPLTSLMLLFIVYNMFAMLCHGVWSAMILARSGGAAAVLGFTESASAVGFGLGGLLLVVWSGLPVGDGRGVRGWQYRGGSWTVSDRLGVCRVCRLDGNAGHERAQPVHLAMQGPGRRPGTGVLGTHAAVTGHHACGHDRLRMDGRPGVRARHAAGRKSDQAVWPAGGHWPRFRHGRDVRRLRRAGDGRRGGRFLHSSAAGRRAAASGCQPGGYGMRDCTVKTGGRS